MDEERRNGSNWDDKTIPLEEEQTVPLRENIVFSNQVRKPKLKHARSSNERSSYNQSQGNRPPYGQSQDSQSWVDPHSRNPYQQGGQNPYSGNNNPYQQSNQNPYDRQPYPPMGQNPYSQQSNQNPYNHQPYPQGNFNAYGSQSYPQGNSNVYGQQSNLQGEPISYDQPSYIQTPVKVRSKMLFIIAGALIVILFLGGLAIGLISSNKSGTQANKNSQNAEQGDSSKTLVQNGDFDTVVTVKSKDIDNIKLFKEPGGKKKAGKVQEAINASNKARHDSVSKRKEILLGTNQYPNFNEKAGEKQPIEAKCCCGGDAHTCEKDVATLVSDRAASEFEALRLETEASGKRPKAFMLTIGNLAMRQARAQYSCNFLACAGYEVIDNLGFETVEAGIEAAMAAKADIVVLCSSDDEYAEYAIPAFKALNGRAMFIVAGAPACMDELKAAGIENFIHVRVNVLDTLKEFNAKLLK